MFNETFWALIGLILFLAILVYYKVPAMMANSLDGRAEKIRNELEEARRLREEAQQLLAEYQRKRKDAEAEAEQIVEAAKREAAGIAKDARQRTEEYVERRNLLAEQKIARAESEAVEEVKIRAVEIATAAAERLIEDNLDQKARDRLIKDSIGQANTHLN